MSTGTAIAEGSKHTILVVDDDTTILSLLEMALGLLGYKVLIATSCNEAVSEVNRNCSQPLDLLLTDVHLSPTNGPGVARAITALRPGLPVVYMSGDTREHIEKLAGAGTQNPIRFLPKPFRLDTLVQKIREAIALPKASPV
jgi:two-component system cell cycle sensor histidine kinase/response regulator CckA